MYLNGLKWTRVDYGLGGLYGLEWTSFSKSLQVFVFLFVDNDTLSVSENSHIQIFKKKNEKNQKQQVHMNITHI